MDIKIKAEDQNFDHKLASLKVVKRERCGKWLFDSMSTY